MNQEIFNKLAEKIESIINNKFERGYKTNDVRIREAGYGKKEGWYFNLFYNRGLSQVEEEKVKNLFPITIDGFTFEYHAYIPFESDDDRTWDPSLIFGPFGD